MAVRTACATWTFSITNIIATMLIPVVTMVVIMLKRPEANGVPCAAAFRGMYAFAGDCSMWLQGVTLGQGVNKGPLGGGMMIWYLVGILAQEPKQQWAAAAAQSEAMCAVKKAISDFMLRAEKELPCTTVPFAQASGTEMLSEMCSFASSDGRTSFRPPVWRRCALAPFYEAAS